MMEKPIIVVDYAPERGGLFIRKYESCGKPWRSVYFFFNHRDSEYAWVYCGKEGCDKWEVEPKPLVDFSLADEVSFIHPSHNSKGPECLSSGDSDLLKALFAFLVDWKVSK